VGGLRGKVAIVGAGMIKFGELFDKSFTDQMQEAYLNCVNSVDKGFETKMLDAAWFGQWSGGMIGQGAQAGSPLASGIGNMNIPITRVENGCASGQDAVRNAAIGVASGLYDVVLALGCEKMRDKPSTESLIAAGGGGGAILGYHPSWMLGVGGPSMQALYATRQMYEHGVTQDDFARVAVKNHSNGAKCPYAHFQKEITLEQAKASPPVCWPLTLMDCCPQTDGAAAVILCNAEIAKNFTDKPIYVWGSHLGLDHANYWDKKQFVSILSTVRASKGVYEMAGITPQDLDFAEVHDCFTNIELMHYHDMGFCEMGKGHELLRDGYWNIDGTLPVNPSGGLKAHGHPIAATGVGQICEAFWQLREEAGARQVKLNKGLGLTHNSGGPGFGTAGIHILSREP
jgi:acetyl-CoA C-acetyltransferase